MLCSRHHLHRFEARTFGDPHHDVEPLPRSQISKLLKLKGETLPSVTHHKKQEAKSELHSESGSLPRSLPRTHHPPDPRPTSHLFFSRPKKTARLSAALTFTVYCSWCRRAADVSASHHHHWVTVPFTRSTDLCTQLGDFSALATLFSDVDGDVLGFCKVLVTQALKAGNCCDLLSAPDGGELALKSPGSSAHSLPHQLIAHSTNQKPATGWLTN